ncbi:MAG: WD40 repeat domain-containing protein [Planctomycetales bacterium]|nr:WD40 repeat domain-containing protein [Planctomycetales bacterium]
MTQRYLIGRWLWWAVAGVGAVILLAPSMGGAQEAFPPAQLVPQTLVNRPTPYGSLPDELESFEIRLAPLVENDSPPVITALAASHDGRFLAAAGDDHAIRVIDVASGKTFGTLAGHTDWIQSLVFSSDSHDLYSAGNDGRVLQWQHQYPASHREVLATDFALRAITLSTEQNLLAVCGFSDQVVVWDLNANRVKHVLSCNSQDQRCVRFSPDGKQLLRGGRLGEICVWDTETGTELAHYHQHRRRVFTAAFSTDGRQITSVGEDRQLVRFDLATQQVTLAREIAGGKLMSMCLINDDMVAAAGADNLIHLYDVAAGKLLTTLAGHSGTVAVMVPCGEFLASGSFDTTVRIWDLERIGQRSVDYGKPVHAPLKMDAGLQIR